MTADRPFSRAILAAKRRGSVPLIADIKPVSPRDGNLVGDRPPAALARDLAEAGACALSVVTEPTHFGGSVAMLREVTHAVDRPVLRKDFFRAPQEVDESAQAGAAAILLTLATLTDPLARELYERARACGMEAVVEVHTRAELTRALALGPTIVGINNRDILRLEQDAGDVGVTERLAPHVPAGVVTISESSLRSGSEIRRALAAGADAVLVGTSILQAADVASRVAELTRNTG